jgi:hypothetical protein
MSLFLGYVIYQVSHSKTEQKTETITVPIEKVNFIQIDSSTINTVTKKDTNKTINFDRQTHHKTN